MEIVKIEKEQISSLQFRKSENLDNSPERLSLKKKLHDGMVLGNLHKGKVRIIFNTAEGYREVETTIWAKTENQILLKGGVFIPIESVVDLII
mgnify:CR=1